VNLLKIRRLVLVKFLRDSMVTPRESSQFGFYADRNTSIIVPLQQSRLYTDDLLGLKVMDEQGRLIFLESDTDHLRFTEQWFIDHIIPFLHD
jgi:palmitoyl-protein thioesterase